MVNFVLVSQRSLSAVRQFAFLVLKVKESRILKCALLEVKTEH